MQLTFGQQLTFDQLLLLKSKDLSTVEEFLVERKWSFMGAEEATSESCETAEFAFGQSDFDEDKAVAFFTYVNCSYSTRVIYQMHNKTTYMAIVNRIKQLGYKQGATKIEEGGIIKTFLSKAYIVRVRTSTSANAYGAKGATYLISIYEKIDHDIQFGLSNVQ